MWKGRPLMSLRPEVIGRIILARFLSFSLKPYENKIDNVKNSRIFRALFPDIITFKMFPRADASCDKAGFMKNTLGRIEKDGKSFSIRYRSPGLAGEYLFDGKKLGSLTGRGNFASFRKDEIDLLDRKLRLVSTRNRITHMTLLGIIDHQAAYLGSRDPLKLVPLSRMKISRWIRDHGYQSIDNSMISRVVHDLCVLTPDGKPVPLRDFFPSSRDICKRYIKKNSRRRGDGFELEPA